MPSTNPSLSPREKQTLQLLAGDLSYKEAAAQMGIKVTTVKYYASQARRKMGTKSNIAAGVKAVVLVLIVIPVI